MIDDYSTDRDQEERLRNFWRENWRWIAAGIVLGVAALVGWRWWEAQRLNKREDASQIYSQVQQALNTNNVDEATKLIGQLTQEHGGGAYADQGRLGLARIHVQQERFDQAIAELRAVVDGSEDKEMAAIASLRLARVLSHQGKHDEALAAVKVSDDSAYAALANELRGDVHFAKGDSAKAREAYAAALKGDSAAIDRPLIEMKLQQVGGDPAAASAEIATAAKSES